MIKNKQTTIFKRASLTKAFSFHLVQSYVTLVSTEEDTLSVNKISLSVLGFKKSVHPILFLEPLKRTIYLHCVFGWSYLNGATA